MESSVSEKLLRTHEWNMHDFLGIKKEKRYKLKV
jgi:hypothetical protein